MSSRLFVLLLTSLLGIGGFAAFAASPPTPGPVAVYGGVAALSVTTSSSNVALPVSTATYPVVQIINTGGVEAFVRQGNGAVAATANDMPVEPGASIALWLTPGSTNIAAITAGSATTLRVLQWNGAPVMAGAKGGGTTGNSITNGTVTNSSITGGTVSGTKLVSPLPFVGSGTSGQYDGQISVSGGGSIPAAGTLTYQAGIQSYIGIDGTTLFQIPNVAAAVNFMAPVAGLSGDGAEMYCTNGLFTGTGVYPSSGASGNVDCVHAAQNQGNHWFGNGNGAQLEIADPGAQATYQPVITPGTASTFASYGSNGNTTLSATGTNQVYVTINGAIMFGANNIKTLSSSANFPSFFGSTGTTGYACTNLTGTGTVNCFIQALGSGGIQIWSGGGQIANFIPSGLGTEVDSFLIRASGSDRPLWISGAGTLATGDSIGVGTPTLPANSTTGFLGIPNCVAAPTGTPTKLFGFAYACYNTATHNLNLYDQVAGSWYHVTLTAGAL